MGKKFKKTVKKRNKNLMFIYVLVGIGLTLIGVSFLDFNKKTGGKRSTFKESSPKSEKKFQPNDSKRNMPGKLMWGRDF